MKKYTRNLSTNVYTTIWDDTIPKWTWTSLYMRPVNVQCLLQLNVWRSFFRKCNHISLYDFFTTYMWQNTLSVHVIICICRQLESIHGSGHILSWCEVWHFVSFLNRQLECSERSVFCLEASMEGSSLAGLKNFVVKFMIQMSQVRVFSY